jgi:hypothetical protein
MVATKVRFPLNFMRATAIEANSATNKLIVTVKKTTISELIKALTNPSLVTAST